MRRDIAFTLIELIVVVGIIIVFSGLVLATVGYVRNKGALPAQRAKSLRWPPRGNLQSR